MSSSMSVAALKRELTARGIDFSGCTEKRELVALLDSAPMPQQQQQRQQGKDSHGGGGGDFDVPPVADALFPELCRNPEGMAALILQNTVTIPPAWLGAPDQRRAPGIMHQVVEMDVAGQEVVSGIQNWGQRGGTRRAAMKLLGGGAGGKGRFDPFYRAAKGCVTLATHKGELPALIVAAGNKELGGAPHLGRCWFFCPSMCTFPDDGIQLPGFARDYRHLPTDKLHWPEVGLVVQCPVCRRQQRPGEKDEADPSKDRRLVMALQQFIVPTAAGPFSSVRHQRLFCVDCFARLVDSFDSGRAATSMHRLVGTRPRTALVDENGRAIRFDDPNQFRGNPFPVNFRNSSVAFPPWSEPLPAYTRHCLFEIAGLSDLIHAWVTKFMSGVTQGNFSHAYSDPMMSGGGMPAASSTNFEALAQAGRLGEFVEAPPSACDQCRQEFPGRKLQRCGGCRIAKYCGADCQRKGWSVHKHQCKKWRAAAAQQKQEQDKPGSGGGGGGGGAGPAKTYREVD